MIYFVLGALSLILFLSASGADFGKLFPLFGDSGGSIVKPLKSLPLSCGDFTVLFIALGQVNRTKRFTAAAVSSAGAAVAVIMVFSLLIFSAFIDTRHLLDAAQNITAASHTGIARFSFGRFDKIAYTALAGAVLIALAVWFHAAVRTAQYVTGVRKSFWPSVILAVAVYAAAAVMPLSRIYGLIDKYSVYFVPVFALGFPLLLLILSVTKRRGIEFNAHTGAEML